MNWFKTIVFTACLGATLSVAAQGSAFTYQGRLNNAGAPANGLYDFRFQLFADSGGVNPIGPNSLASGVAVSNGLFAASLDFGAGIFNGSNYWLQIGVRTNGGASYTNLSPLQPLLPSPYAIFANTASNLSGTLTVAQMPAGVVTNNSAGLTLSGTFVGNGAGLTNIGTAANATTLGGISAAGFIQNQNIAPQAANLWINGSAAAGSMLAPTLDSGTGALQLKVAGMPGLQLMPTTIDATHTGIVNVVLGSPGNYAGPTVRGATIGGGGAIKENGFAYTNKVTADYGTISGGYNNQISGIGSSVGGGVFQVAQGQYAAINGGNANLAASKFAAIGGGAANAALDPIGTVEGATIAGGGFNTNNAYYTTIGGGSHNTATNDYATVPGGLLNTAGGSYSFAAGRRAKAVNQGAFVWADSQSADFTSTANDQFLIRAAGGVGINTTVPEAPLHVVPSAIGAGLAIGVDGFAGGYTALQMDVSSLTNGYAKIQAVNRSGFTWGNLILNPNGGNVGIGMSAPTTALQVNGTVTATAFNPPSDRNMKENFTQVEPVEVLERVATLPITRWNFKGDAGTVHIGPMAQDFREAFGLGTDERHIATVDADGVALAAIQGLNQKLAEKETLLRKLETQNEAMSKRIERLEKLLAARQN